MAHARKQTKTWWPAAGLFAISIALVLASVGDLRRHASAPATTAFDMLVRHAEGDREWLRVTDGQDGSVRLYDVRDGRPLAIAATSAE